MISNKMSNGANAFANGSSTLPVESSEQLPSEVRVEIVNTGTELLLGNVVNTHAAYFGRLLFTLGMRVRRQTTVPDGSAIQDAITETLGRSDVVLITGGLGPTGDDVTREAVAHLLGVPLMEDAEIRAHLMRLYERRGIGVQERFMRQAQRPEMAMVLSNEVGSAPGLYIPPVLLRGIRTPHLFLLPGPPRELHPMMEASVLPLLHQLYPKNSQQTCRIYRCVGIGESMVESRIGLRIESRGDIEVGYCARPDEVDFRLVGPQTILDQIESEIFDALGDFIAVSGEVPLEQVVVDALRSQQKTIAVAESCTGGRLANRLTDVPGASEVFLQGFVTYSNAAKTSMLGVDPQLIGRVGAVSEEVARAMAEGARERSGAHFALSTTGLAGPGGGTPEKPVGLIFIGLAEEGCEAQVTKRFYPADRDTFKQVASQAALDLVRRRMQRR